MNVKLKAAGMEPYTTPPAAPVQAPVGVVGWAANRPNTVPVVHWADECPEIGTKIYTTPPAAQRQWVGLTDEEEDAAFEQSMAVRPKDASNKETRRLYARAIEAKLKEKNV